MFPKGRTGGGVSVQSPASTRSSSRSDRPPAPPAGRDLERSEHGDRLLHVEDPVGLRQPVHDLLLAGPHRAPVERRDADYVFSAKHGNLSSSLCRLAAGGETAFVGPQRPGSRPLHREEIAHAPRRRPRPCEGAGPGRPAGRRRARPAQRRARPAPGRVSPRSRSLHPSPPRPLRRPRSSPPADRRPSPRAPTSTLRPRRSR